MIIAAVFTVASLCLHHQKQALILSLFHKCLIYKIIIWNCQLCNDTRCSIIIGQVCFQAQLLPVTADQHKTVTDRHTHKLTDYWQTDPHMSACLLLILPTQNPIYKYKGSNSYDVDLTWTCWQCMWVSICNHEFASSSILTESCCDWNGDYMNKKIYKLHSSYTKWFK